MAYNASKLFYKAYRYPLWYRMHVKHHSSYHILSSAPSDPLSQPLTGPYITCCRPLCPHIQSLLTQKTKHKCRCHVSSSDPPTH